MELKLENYREYTALEIILLIVPYGIETGGNDCRIRKDESFNRTLWN